MIKKLNKIQIINIIAFLIVPFISSIISTIHIVSFFEIGNLVWMSYLLAISFELGSISSALAITVLDKISKFAVWSIFLTLITFQVIGNVYYSFEYITYIELNNPEYLNTINTFLNFFYEFETQSDFKVFLCILIGSPIPLISLAFLKSLVDYLNGILIDVDDNKDNIDLISVDYDINDDDVDNVDNVDNVDDIKKSQEAEIELLKMKLEDKDNELTKAYDKMKVYKLNLFGDVNGDSN